MSACRSCHKPVRWVVTLKGKKMPLNVKPDPAGNVIVEGNAAIVCSPHDPRLLDGRPRFMPHHATCPERGQWKRKP